MKFLFWFTYGLFQFSFLLLKIVELGAVTKWSWEAVLIPTWIVITLIIVKWYVISWIDVIIDFNKMRKR